MAPATDVMTGPGRRAAALARERASALNRPDSSEREEPTEVDEPEAHAVDAAKVAGFPEPPVEEEPEDTESPADGDDEPDHPETLGDEEAGRAGRPTVPIERVSALLAEALRLGLQYHLVEKQPDGTLLLAGQSRTTRRESSDCTCQQCTPHAQQHWICVVCHSGPHDWLMVKPQYERQALKPGGIEGTRHAACSAQCARDYLSTLGRQPSGVPLGRGIDPTLALP